ncbi:hypothetical protein FGRMN_4439 [Fusarium graminum]|nr:hypothetical protein FGRMN_4439 [Fusarium graminum]
MPDGDPLPDIQFVIYTETESQLLPSLGSLVPYLESMELNTSVNFIQEHVFDCVRHHEACEKPSESRLPTRIISIGSADSDMKLVELKDVSAPYITLSHCWGGKQPIRTTLSNLADMKGRIISSSLPIVFKQAISVARTLQVNYIWIDSLCIIQDSLSDWELESARMCGYYQNALLTISTASSSDSSVPFLGPRDSKWKPVELELVTDQSKESLRAQRIPNTPDEEGKLFTRGWAWQESAMSSRIAYFTPSELIWECREHIVPQRYIPDLVTSERLGLPWKIERSPSEMSSSSWSTVSSQLDSATPHYIWDEWRDLVRQYSLRELTFFLDRLPALSGVASYVYRATQSRYLAGMWEDDLVASLCWIQADADFGIMALPDDYVAPSWSWASVLKGVEGLVETSIETFIPSFDISEANCQVPGLNPFGRVSSGYIRLQGQLSKALLTCDKPWQTSAYTVSEVSDPLDDWYFYPDTSEVELELLASAPTPDNASWDNDDEYSPPSMFQSSTNAFQNAWKDLLAFQPFCRPPTSESKRIEWRRVGCHILIVGWNLTLLALVIYLALSPTAYFGQRIPCQPNGEFHFGDKDWFYGFNYWKASSFFEITLGWGRFSFATAKMIDVAWDLVVGRGFQVIMAWASWRVFAEYLQVSIATKPATFNTVWLLRFQKDASAYSTLRLMLNFWKRGLESKTAMCFIIFAALFILAFPTVAGSMTGYTPYNEPYITSTKNRLTRLSDVHPLAYLIHDGERIDGFRNNHAVPWKNNISWAIRSDMYYPDSYCHYWSDESLEEGYVQWYGFDASGGNQTSDDQPHTEFRGQKIDWPPLNISAFYLPSDPFYWNWTGHQEGSGLSTKLREENPYGDASRIKYIVDDAVYDTARINAHGVCQPFREMDSMQKYQWGFSFLQLFTTMILLQLWSFGLAILRTEAHRTLRLNGHVAASGSWKGFLEFTDTIKLQLDHFGIDPYTLEEDQLDHKIAKVLRGGNISSPPFAERHLSIWRWTWNQKQWIALILFFVTLIIIDHLFRFDGYESFKLSMPNDAIVFSILYATFCLILAFIIGTNIRQRIVTYLIAAGFCVPFFWYHTFVRDMVLPGVIIGAILAMSIGSTRGSRIVLFAVPTCCNYLVILALFISSFTG